MFGYVKPFKPELKVCELEAYKAVYCGLCGQLGKSFGPLSRFTLSYDFAFLSMLYFGVQGKSPKVSKARCFFNPLKKSLCVEESEALSFSADVAAITLYYKLMDNIADSRILAKYGWMSLLPLISPARKKAAARRPEADDIVKRSMSLQAELESKNSSSLDEASEPTAMAMSGICALMSEDEKTRRVLSRFGYFLGRYAYISDAVDDLEDDLKHRRYNPLILRFDLKPDNPCVKDAVDFAKQSVYMTIGEAANAYALLSVGDFAPVLENIIALGLRCGFDEILANYNYKITDSR